MKEYTKSKESMQKKKGRKEMLIELATIALAMYVGYKFYIKYKTYKDDRRKAMLEDRNVQYRSKIEEIEKKEYPKFLSYKLYIESKIRELPPDIVKKIEEKYGFRKDEPILDLGTLKYDPEFQENLKKRMEREPEIVKKLPSTGSIPLDYKYFLSKKAELEAIRIINEAINSE